MKLYKVLNDGKSCSGGTFDWTPYLPHDGEPGAWTPIVENVRLCNKGYHGTNAANVINFMNGNELWEVEPSEALYWDDEKRKFVCSSLRLVRKIEAYNDKNLRLFACWCLRQIWHLLTDERSKNAVEVLEKYANGEASKEELAVARDAAWAVAGDAARAAAWDAARAAAWDAAWDAARAAARAAAWAAAWAAARDAALDAARDAERKWQIRHLLKLLKTEAQK